MKNQPIKVDLGQTLITSGARDTLHPEDVQLAMRRHARGDWGDCTAADKEANDLALTEGGPLFSVFHDRNDIWFWVITEADHYSTTVILPSEYCTERLIYRSEY